MPADGFGHLRWRGCPTIGPDRERIPGKEIGKRWPGAGKSQLGSEVPTAGVEPGVGPPTHGMERRRHDRQGADLAIDKPLPAGIGAHRDHANPLGVKRRDGIPVGLVGRRVPRFPIEPHDPHGGPDTKRPGHESIAVSDERVRRS